MWSDQGTPSIGAAYTYDDGTNPAVWKFAYRPDSPNPPESWTYETIDEGSIDNHISVAAGNVGGGTGSTVVVVVKTTSGDALFAWKRPPGSSWSSAIQLTGGATGLHASRHKVVIDESNKEVYVVYGRSPAGGESNINGIAYQKMPIDNLAVADEITVIETDSPTNGDFDDPTAPAHVVNSTTGLLVASFGPAVSGQAGIGAWWNILTIAAPPGGGLLPKMMQYGLFTGEGGGV